MSIPFDDLIEEEFKATRLIEEAKEKAESILSEARKKAQRLIDKATKPEHFQEIIREEEEKAKREADAILKSYVKKVSRLKNLPDKSFEKAVELAVSEVLRVE